MYTLSVEGAPLFATWMGPENDTESPTHTRTRPARPAGSRSRPAPLHSALKPAPVLASKACRTDRRSPYKCRWQMPCAFSRGFRKIYERAGDVGHSARTWSAAASSGRHERPADTGSSMCVKASGLRDTEVPAEELTLFD